MSHHEGEPIEYDNLTKTFINYDAWEMNVYQMFQNGCDSICVYHYFQL